MPQAYFPPLDKCLAGEERLISWKTAYRTLCYPECAVEEAALEAFLTDSRSVNCLASALDPFLPPSAKTNADFETKTAPIHVSQSTNGEYNLEDLKKDAQWLSEKVEIEELIALRVVVLEWQQRAEDELRTGPTLSVDLTQSKLGTSFAASTNGSGAVASDFSKEEIRHERQLAIFLEEKSHILKISADLIGRVATQEDQESTAGRNWLDYLASKVAEELCSSNDSREHIAFCASIIDTVDTWISKLDDNSKWPTAFRADDAKQLLYAAATAQDSVTALRLLLANLYMLQRLPDASTVTAWFKMTTKVNFFQNLSPSPAIPDTSALQCLVSSISLAIFHVPGVLGHIRETAETMFQGSLYPRLPEESYIRNDECVKAVNLTLHRAARENVTVASPAIYAWSLITSIIRDVAKFQRESREQQHMDEGSDDSEPIGRRRTSRRDSRDELSIFEKQLEVLKDFDLEGEAREDPPGFLARAAVDRMDVYSVMVQLSTIMTTIYCAESDIATSYVCRSSLLELVREGVPMVSYGAEVVESILAILSPEVPGRFTKLDSRLSNRFLTDRDVLRPEILDQALARYPFELAPVLRLLSALTSAPNSYEAGSPDLVSLLENLTNLTVMVNEHFRDYELEHEDENTNSIVLTETLPLFASKQTLSFYGMQNLSRRTLTTGRGEDEISKVLAIPGGTAGVVVKESRPLVLRLEHPHSGLEYLGLLLSTLLPDNDLIVAPMDSQLDRTTAAEIITLITSLLKSCFRQHQGIEEARFVLGRLSFALKDQVDSIAVIGDIFEVELLAHLDQSAQDGSLELLIACAEFFDALITISPERVWSKLARSSLLGITGGANALAAVVAGTEVPTGRYRFLATCVTIYTHLITDAIAGLVRRKARINKSTNRFDSPLSFQDATPERTMTTVLSAFQPVMIDAWQSLGDWRFSIPSEKSKITSSILQAFEQLLRCTYGIEAGESRISALLYPSATALLNAFATDSGNSMTSQSILTVLSAGLAADNPLFSPHLQHFLVQQVQAAFDFSSTLLRTARVVDPTGKRAHDLGAQLLTGMPTFASLLSTDHAFKSNLCLFLDEIVKSVNITTGADTPSLLGQLNPGMAKSFLAVISQFDQPLRDIQVESSIWTFLSSVMSSRQQWFAMYLLTGSIPRDRLKEGKGNDISSKSKSLLAYALEQLAGLATMPPERAMAMLKFVASAQNTWVWATNEVRSRSDFLKNSLEWLNNLQVPKRMPNIAEEIILANEHQMAGSLCDILAVNIHASNEVGDKTVLKMLSSKLSFLRQHGVAVNAYKRSLQLNLAENFSKKFPSCELADFKKSSANPAPFGRKFFYDLDLASKVLGHEMAWYGVLNGRGQGFSDEFARANVNLSLVEAQTRLLKSWKALSTTLCECVDEDATLQGELAKTAEKCLSANMEANLEQPRMDEIVRTRAEMAFVIISKLVSIKSADEAMRSLLPATWNLVRSSPVDYDVATAAEDLVYYRTLLQVLYLSIQPHVYMELKSRPVNREPRATDETKVEYLDPAIASSLVQIVAKVIAPGFRALCGNLHSSIDLAQPGDFALLTALLQAILSVHGISAVHLQLAEVIASTSIVRGALSLYSWADQLAEVMDEDPIYGEVAVMFLLSLSTIRTVAEQMALDGVLVQLSSANLSNYFRKEGGKGPFSEPKRMFVIWTEGFLPLCLNLLDAVGPPIAAEVSSFLNSFPEQLQRANTALENRESTRQNPYAGAVTLSLVSEAHSLCLIALIVASDIARGAAEGINGADVPPLNYEHEKVKEDVAGLVRQKTSLAARITPVGEREQAWWNSGLRDDNVLLAKIQGEIKNCSKCFG